MSTIILQSSTDIATLSINELIDKAISGMVDFAIDLAIAALVFIIGKFIIRRIHNVVAAILIRRKVDRSLTTFILSLVKIVLYFILTIIVIGILGLETSSFLALFASAGVAIGMALSGTLQNFAGGVLILLLKPYKVGDYIEAQGFEGKVTDIQIFHTIINTYDNKSIIIPNGGLSTGSINNWSREDYRRIDWKIGISYGNNVDTARKVILGMFANDDRIVKGNIEDDRENRKRSAPMRSDNSNDETNEIEPTTTKHSLFHRKSRLKAAIETRKEQSRAKTKAMIPKTDGSPAVNLSDLGDSSVVLVAKAWVPSKYYWAVYYDINEQIYNELPKHGISFPYPQMDIHISK